ncbi:MAG TPA: aspartate-semialdehyde dehydrogenase, partial [Candidatus Methylomirabilis sp.]
MRKDGYVVAVAGATGAVGEVMLQVLEERKFPVRRIKLLASERSVGKTLSFRGETVKV